LHSDSLPSKRSVDYFERNDIDVLQVTGFSREHKEGGPKKQNGHQQQVETRRSDEAFFFAAGSLSGLGGSVRKEYEMPLRWPWLDHGHHILNPAFLSARCKPQVRVRAMIYHQLFSTWSSSMRRFSTYILPATDLYRFDVVFVPGC